MDPGSRLLRALGRDDAECVAAP